MSLHDRPRSRAHSLRAALPAAVGVAAGVAAIVVTVVAGLAGGGGAARVAVPSSPQVAPDVAPPAAVAASSGAGASRLDPQWVGATAARAGIPGPAIRAYAEAQLRLAEEGPDCRIGWTTLAGIGWVESQHGTIDGREVLADGRPSTAILGPALDGTGGFKAIRATPTSAAWHGNARWDHAVGPMQFIPSTWARWASDGDGDGVSDPHDLDDAAYAAGRYLCADGHDLGTGDGWGAAVFSYNHAREYVLSVHSAATAYADRVR